MAIQMQPPSSRQNCAVHCVSHRLLPVTPAVAPSRASLSGAASSPRHRRQRPAGSFPRGAATARGDSTETLRRLLHERAARRGTVEEAVGTVEIRLGRVEDRRHVCRHTGGKALRRQLRKAGIERLDRALGVRAVTVTLADLVRVVRIRRVDLVLEDVLGEGPVALDPRGDHLRDALAGTLRRRGPGLVRRVDAAGVVSVTWAACRHGNRRSCAPGKRLVGRTAARRGTFARRQPVLAVENPADQPGDRAHPDAAAGTARILRDRRVRRSDEGVDRRRLTAFLVERRRLAVGRLEGRLRLLDVTLDHRAHGLPDSFPDRGLAALGRLVARRGATIVAEGHRAAARIDTLTRLVAVVADWGPGARWDSTETERPR